MPASTNHNIIMIFWILEKQMHKLHKNEEIFYKDQSSTSKFQISKEIDEEQEIKV